MYLLDYPAAIDHKFVGRVWAREERQVSDEWFLVFLLSILNAEWDELCLGRRQNACEAKRYNQATKAKRFGKRVESPQPIDNR